MDDVTSVGVGSDELSLVCGYEALRTTARNWSSFSSNTPFRVPIPEESQLRDTQQLPIETDPPQHQVYRSLIERRFTRAMAERIKPVVAELVASIVWERDTSIRVVDAIALPIVARSIAESLGHPEDAARIESWGVHVFTNPVTGQRERNADVDAYLAWRVDQARAGGSDGLFGDLIAAEIFDRPVSKEEMLGIGSLVLAGGRDTVINAIVGALWFLATHDDERQRLREEPASIPAAVEEFLRYFSPLPFIGRTATASDDLFGCPVDEGELIALGFAAANHDPRAFDLPDHVALDRRPNRHVAFGHGPHTCIGAPLARMEVQAVVEWFVMRAPRSISCSVPWAARPPEAAVSTDWIPRHLQLRRT